MRKLNITEDMAEDRKQWRQLISCLTPGVGNLGTVNEDDDMKENMFFFYRIIIFIPNKENDYIYEAH